jgi:hypothetical protein
LIVEAKKFKMRPLDILKFFLSKLLLRLIKPAGNGTLKKLFKRLHMSYKLTPSAKFNLTMIMATLLLKVFAASRRLKSDT